jgi:uncharacterized protein involved in outer membrane biogenesis
MRPRVLIGTVVVLCAVALVTIAALPAVVRVLAVRQIEGLTGRPAAIGAVDIDLFARRVTLSDVRVSARGGAPPAVEIPRVVVRVALAALVRGRVDVPFVAIDEPVVRLRRDEAGRLDVDDVIEHVRTRPAAEPRPFDIQRLTMGGGRVVFHDAEVDPAYVWKARSVALDSARRHRARAPAPWPARASAGRARRRS